MERKSRNRASSNDTPNDELNDALRTSASQDVAYKLASYLLVAKSDKKAATIFSYTDSSSSFPHPLLSFRRRPESSSPQDLSRRKIEKQALNYLRDQRRSDESTETDLSEDHKQELAQIRQKLAIADDVYLEEKKDNFGLRNRAWLLLKAKSARLNGLNKEEKIQMYREAGYSESDILKITGKKLLISAGLSTALTFAANGITGAAIANDNLIPFVHDIPQNYNSLSVGASLLTYIGSYVYVTEKNLKLTKKFGVSTNPSVTGIYLAGNRLLPDRTRDWMARGIPIGLNSITHTVVYPAIIEGVTANSDKIIAGSLTSSAINIALAMGYEAFMKKKAARGK
jgi:hypothetical protein